MDKYVLIIGAKSDIAIELAKIYSSKGYNLYLAGREINSLKDKINKTSSIFFKEFDITDFNSHEEFYNSLEPKPEGIIIASGYLGEQKECERDFQKTLNTINVNYTGAVSILNIVANSMEKNKQGFIVGISSVAGDRGRGTNYIYGSSKAGFSTYLSGLRNRLYKSNVTVLTVKPGFVYTKMTQHLHLPKLITANAADTALTIFNAQQQKKNILYTKGIWRLIMCCIKALPEFIFKRMNI